MDTKQVEALVIGAGPGGYVAAIRLAQLGKKVLLVERASLGGVCLNVGCIPSKALITAAKTFEKLKKAETMGITVTGATVDFAKTVAWKDGVVKKLTTGIGVLVKGNGGEVLMGTATFKSPTEVEVATETGPVRVQAEHIVLATGSVPIEIPGFKFDSRRVISSTGALSLLEVPRRLVVIGGGYIGLELGMMFAKLGAQVQVVEAMDQVLPGFDADIAQLLSRSLKKQGVKVHLAAKALGYTEGPEGARVQIEQDGKTLELEADRILVTVGRRPSAEGLGLEIAGVTTDAKGFVPTDRQMRTNVPHIFAIGDLAGQPMLAHKASKEAEVAAEAIAGHPVAMDVRAIPAVVFTDPEIGAVGMSEAAARAAGRELKVGKFPFAALGRAMTTMETDGFVKVVADAATEEVLGVQIVGPEAANLIAEAGLALEMGAFLDDLSLTIHAHPTLAEGLMEAAKAAKGEAIHALNREAREPAGRR